MYHRYYELEDTLTEPDDDIDLDDFDYADFYDFNDIADYYLTVDDLLRLRAEEIAAHQLPNAA